MLSNKIIVNVCVNVSRTSYRQATDRLPTHYQQSADCRPTVGNISGKTCRPSVGQLSADRRPTVGRQTANCRPTVGRQTPNCRPTGFLGSSSSQLPILEGLLEKKLTFLIVCYSFLLSWLTALYNFWKRIPHSPNR